MRTCGLSPFVKTVYERSNDEHFVSRRVPRVPSGARPAAAAGDRTAPCYRGGGRRQTRTPARRGLPAGLRLPAGKQPNRSQVLGVIHARLRHPRHLQLHVLARRRPAVCGLHSPARCIGRSSQTHHAARQSRRRRQGSIASHPGPCTSAWLAVAAVVVLERQHLQTHLLWRDRARQPNADGQRIPARRRSNPPFLEHRTSLRSDRSWTRLPPQRPHRPTLESIRLHAPGARDRLASRAELLLTVVVLPWLDAPTHH